MKTFFHLEPITPASEGGDCRVYMSPLEGVGGGLTLEFFIYEQHYYSYFYLYEPTAKLRF